MNKINHLIIDVDGTLTDGTVYIGSCGEVCKGFYVRDGLGILNLISHNITPVILTARNSEIVRQRCKELGIIEIHQGVSDKEKYLIHWLEKNQVLSNQVAYIADDINDYNAMKLVKLRGCPRDAIDEIKSISDFISKFNGGQGAVREFCDYIISEYS